MEKALTDCVGETIVTYGRTGLRIEGKVLKVEDDMLLLEVIVTEGQQRFSGGKDLSRQMKIHTHILVEDIIGFDRIATNLKIV